MFPVILSVAFLAFVVISYCRISFGVRRHGKSQTRDVL